MATRWEVERAVVKSDLEPSARLIVFALLVKVDNDTATILPEKTPSFTELQAMTGLSRSALAEWLAALDAAGWVKRTKAPPDRTRYALGVGQPTAERSRKAQSAQRTSPPDGPVRTANHHTPDSATSGSPHSEPSSPSGSPPTGPEASEASPPSGPSSSLSSESSPTGNSTSSSGRRKRVSDQPRPDVERLCRYLADWVVRNGSKPPPDPLSKAWRDAARLLIDRDGRTEEQITKAIDWCQQDQFWRANVLSMPTLRAKYDQLRLAAMRNGARASPKHQPHQNDPNADYHGDL